MSKLKIFTVLQKRFSLIKSLLHKFASFRVGWIGHQEFEQTRDSGAEFDSQIFSGMLKISAVSSQELFNTDTTKI